VHRLILTKLDETESFGSLVAQLAAIGKPVSYLTDGQNVPDDIMRSDPDRLADLVFRGQRAERD
jgi:flagellar biosynthesis protein FlhF